MIKVLDGLTYFFLHHCRWCGIDRERARQVRGSKRVGHLVLPEEMSDQIEQLQEAKKKHCYHGKWILKSFTSLCISILKCRIGLFIRYRPLPSLLFPCVPINRLFLQSTGYLLKHATLWGTELDGNLPAAGHRHVLGHSLRPDCALVPQIAIISQ